MLVFEILCLRVGDPHPLSKLKDFEPTGVGTRRECGRSPGCEITELWKWLEDPLDVPQFLLVCKQHTLLHQKPGLLLKQFYNIIWHSFMSYAISIYVYVFQVHSKCKYFKSSVMHFLELDSFKSERGVFQPF